MNDQTKKKLGISLGLLSLLAAGTIGVVATQHTSETTQESSIQQPVEKEKPTASSKKKSSEKKKEKKSDAIVQKTYGQFDIESDHSTKEKSNRSTNLTSKELVAVAAAIKHQKEEQQAKQETIIPSLPTEQKKEKPKEPIVKPPVVTSTPEISYQKDLVIVKGTTINPYDYFTVSDSQDTNVSITVDTSMLDTTIVGTQSFLVIATNKFGNHATAKIPVYVASKPAITVSTDSVAIPIGTDFNPMTYVQATDEMDGDLSGAITVSSSTVDLTKEGTYVVTYSVINQAGIVSTAALEVKVINEKPTIIASNSSHEINTSFDPLVGVSAVAFNGESIPTNEIKVVENTVDSSKEGSYSVKYQVADRFGKESDVVTRIITVENEAPELHGVQDLTYPVGTVITKELLLEHVTATDREDDKTGTPLLITVDDTEFEAIQSNKVGNYPVTYSVTDSMGKKTSKTITLSFVGEKPVIHGLEDKTIELNTTFDPLEGVTVTDKEDGVIPVSAITLTGFVDHTTPGDYILTYQVTDSDGQSSELYTRTITVKAAQRQVSFKTLSELPSELVDPQTGTAANVFKNDKLTEKTPMNPIDSEYSQSIVHEKGFSFK